MPSWWLVDWFLITLFAFARFPTQDFTNAGVNLVTRQRASFVIFLDINNANASDAI
jgi:hypothetical protein